MGASLVFIDFRVQDQEDLIPQFDPAVEVHLIDGATGGIEQIAAALQGRSGIDAVHVISHGSEGALLLGDSLIAGDDLAARTDLLAAIGESLSTDGDILLYACNLAAGQAGLELIATLAKLTGADVAASDDPTGAAASGGDWTLEVATGGIGSVTINLPDADFSGVLATPSSLGDVSSVSLTGDSQINALLLMSKWGGAVGSPTTVTYSFPDADSSWSTSLATGYGNPGDPDQEPHNSQYHGLTPAEQAGVEAALAAWASVANISFVLVDDDAGSAGDLRFAYTGTMEPSTWAYAYGPSPTSYAGDVWLNYDLATTDFSSFAPGTIGSEVLIHEIGHALGLKHPFDTADGNNTTLPGSLDNLSMTTMSYDVATGIADTGDNISIYPTTPMSLDIRAIQHLYGANTSYHAGNDTYVFASNQAYFQTIWDAGGTDTIEYSGSGGSEIDLRPGAWSDLGIDITYDGTQLAPNRYTVQIYDTVTIENAVGGAGNDLMTGNSAGNALSGGGGIDTIAGGAGNDTLAGGSGNDIFDYAAAGEGSDTIADLTPGDRIRVAGAAFSGAATSGSGTGIGRNQVRIADSGGDTLLYIGTNSTPGADIVILLDGAYLAEQFLLNGNLIGLRTANTQATGSVSIMGNAAEDQILTVADTLADSDGLPAHGYTWQSSSNGTTWITAGSGSSLILGDALVGRQIRVTTSYTDGLGYTESATSDATGAVVAINDAPTGGISLSGAAASGQVLGVSGTLADADGLGSITYTWHASRDGTNWTPVGSGTSLALTNVLIGQQVRVLAGYTDQQGFVESATSPASGPIVGSEQADTATGGAGNDILDTRGGGDTINGFAGDDQLLGGSGNDSLDGGSGADTLTGGLGDDHYILADTLDSLIELPGGGYDTVLIQLADGSYLLPYGIEAAILDAASGLATLTGNAGANALTGNALANALAGNAGNDSLYGLGGDDTMTGGPGNDSYYVDSSADMSIEQKGEGDDTVYASTDYILPENIERLILLGTDALSGSGNSLANTVTGNDGTNILLGLAGNDVLTGNGGDDWLDGGPGNDVLNGGLGNDTYVIDSRSDSINDSGGSDTVIIDYAPGTYSLGSRIEYGILREAAGTARLAGNGSANRLTGNSQANEIYGGRGADTVIGGAGSDILNGGKGADLFVFDNLVGTDEVQDFARKQGDRLVFDDAVFTGLGTEGSAIDAAAFVAGAGLTAGQDADDRLVFDTAAGNLYYDADGSGAQGAVLLAHLGGVNLAAGDCLVG